MIRLVLGSGLLRRHGELLLVRCLYAGEPEPLWTLPGGRQEAGESIVETVAREFLEETSLRVEIGDLAYVSESIDPAADLHVLNCTFWVSESEPLRAALPADPKVLAADFVPTTLAPALLQADVLRIPVAAALSGGQAARYFSFDPKTVEIPFFGRATSRPPMSSG
jgi:ADP-ribose pyrophosphatase YjhB (NUDIX family)